MLVQCMNKSCNKVIDVREKQIHIKIYHPNFLSLARTTKDHNNVDRFMTPKEIVKLLFTEIKNKNGDERVYEI